MDNSFIPIGELECEVGLFCLEDCLELLESNLRPCNLGIFIGIDINGALGFVKGLHTVLFPWHPKIWRPLPVKALLETSQTQRTRSYLNLS